jgi:hypothetical protein
MPAIKYGTNEIRTTFNEGGQNYVELTEAEISQGFVPLTPVDAEPCNFIQNRADADINFLKRQCGAEWRSDTDYVVNNTVISPLDGFYRCAIANAGVDPDTDTGGRWVLAQTPVPDASETVKGILKISTSAIALAGTDNTTAISPEKLKVVLDGQTPSNAIDLGDVDLYDFTLQSQAGFYSQQSSLFGTVSNNYPVNGGNWVIQVLSRGTTANRLSMLAINMSTYKLYINNNLGSWGGWLEPAKEYAIGEGQTWQDLTSSRGANVTYTNNTSRSIQVSIGLALGGGSPGTANFTVDGVIVSVGGGSISSKSIQNAVIPSGSNYSTVVSGAGVILHWSELR